MNEDILIERLVNRQQKANEKILKEIGKVLGEIGNLTPSQAYTIGQQLKYGESLDNIIKILKETSKINEKEIYQMFEEVAKENLDFSEKYFKAKNIDFIPYEKNIALKRKVDEIAKVTLRTYRNIANTTGLVFLNANDNPITKGIKEAYSQIIDDAILNVSLGKETFGESLKNQLKTISRNGIQSIEYESGKHRRIDSALRMNMQDGLNQLSIAQQEILGEQFGNDGWEITTHINPAIDHEDIQGHIFVNEEFDKLQDYDYFGEIKDINGNIYYRDELVHIRPIGELNCYHRAFAIVIGVDKPIYSQEELDKINKDNHKGFEYEGKHYTMYEGTQVQRRLETELRRKQEERISLKSSYDSVKDEVVKQKLALELDLNRKQSNDLLVKYRDFSMKANLPLKLERTRLGMY